jgi:uncharacterized membrane protein
MRTKEFHRRLEHDQIVAALRAAAQKTTGDIRVVVSHRELADPVAAAHRQFVRHGMHKAAQRNGVLILVAPSSQTFAIFGDQGVHQRCGDGFWRSIADAMAKYFAQGQPTQAILHGIAEAARVLGEHFPR